MVKTGCYLVNYWEESGGGGAVGPKTMLGVRQREGVELGKEESLKHLGRRAEERDGPITAGLEWGFNRF